MDARMACLAWIASPLMAGCAAPAAIDVTGLTVEPTAQELVTRSGEKFALGRQYLADGEQKLGGFLLEQAKVDAELATLRAAAIRRQALARPRFRD